MAHFWMAALGLQPFSLATFALCEANDLFFGLSSLFRFARGSCEP